MENSIKPVLFNGFAVGGGVTVKSRIERVFFTDVYELSDGTFLYLFLNLSPTEVLDKKDKYDIVKVENGDEKYVGVVVKEHSREQLIAIREGLTSARGFECIAGMNELKLQLVADVINPLKHPENFKKFKVSIPNGIILFGPPGCGKTFIIRKLAEELAYNYIEVKGSDLATPYIHGSVSNIRKAFDMAKQNAPCILFFDEISALLPNRNNLSEQALYKEEEVNEFLIQLNDAGQ